MSNSNVLRYLLILFMLGGIGFLLGSSYLGTVVESDVIVITHDDIFSGSENNINIQTNLSVTDIKIYLNETLIESNGYDPQTIHNKLPCDLYTAVGEHEGNIEDLSEEDGNGMIFHAEHKHFLCFFDYYYSEIYIVFNTGILKDLDNATLKLYLNSLDEFESKISYYDFISSTWEYLNIQTIDNSYIDLEVILNSSILNAQSIRLKLTGYNSDDDFDYLLDQLSIEYQIPLEFEENFNINVSSFSDGAYILKVETTDYLYTKYINESIVFIDNTAPIINIADFPSNNSYYNDTDIIKFEANIIDNSETQTLLSFELNGSEYITIDFSNSSAISYQNTFLPGIYSYTFSSIDSNGLVSYYSGNFTVEYYEEPPTIIIEENLISISVPSSANEQVVNYPVMIEISGSINNEYLCNLTLNNSEIDSGVLNTNESIVLTSSVFNQSINLKIFNVNNSYSIAVDENYTVFKIPDVKYYDLIQVNYPLITYESGYNVIVFISSSESENDFTYILYNKNTLTLIVSGSLTNDLDNIMYLEVFGVDLILEIYSGEDLIYDTEFRILYNELEEGFDYSLAFLAISIASLLLGILSLIVMTVYRKKEREF